MNAVALYRNSKVNTDVLTHRGTGSCPLSLVPCSPSHVPCLFSIVPRPLSPGSNLALFKQVQVTPRIRKTHLLRQMAVLERPLDTVLVREGARTISVLM